MVRRIGFGKSKLPEDIGELPDDSSVESTYARLKANTKATPQFQSLGAQIFGVVFLGVWLLGWSGAIIFATYELLTGNDFSKFFLVFWIVLASGGWVFAAKTLRALLRGEKIFGGEVKARKTRASDSRKTPATHPAPNKPGSVQGRDTSIRAIQLSGNELLFKITKIVVAVLIAIWVESTIMFIILLLWVGKEIWSLLQKVPTSTAPDK